MRRFVLPISLLVAIAAASLFVAFTPKAFETEVADGSIMGVPAVPNGTVAGSDSGVYDVRIPVCGKDTIGKFCLRGVAVDDMAAAIEIFDRSGPAESLNYLLEKLDAGAEWSQECHQMIHIIGHEAARLYPIADVVAVDNRMCQDGYLDGAMEGFSDYSAEPEFWEGIRTLCLPMRAAGDGWKASSCAHSIGHAIAFRGVGTYREAVLYCDVLPEDLRSSCGSGAIMGIVNPVEGSAVTDMGLPVYSTLDPEIIDATCTDIPVIYATACLSILWTMYPSSWGKEQLLDRLADVCPTSLVVHYCYDGYGSALYQKTYATADERGETSAEVTRAAGLVLQECYALPATGVAGCVQGVTYSAVWWYTTVHSSGKGYASMCPGIPSKWRPSCEAAEDAVLSGY